MSNTRDKRGFGVVDHGDGELSLYAYTNLDVLTAIHGALDVTHKSHVPHPLCCAAAASLLLTAAEMILQGPALANTDVDVADMRSQAAATAVLLNVLHVAKGEACH